MIECHGLDTEDQIFFYEQDFYVLSNFSAFEVRWTDNYNFKTAEHCYHWLRFVTGAANGKLGDAIATDAALVVAYAVASAPSAHEAFKIAQENKHLQRADWDDVKIGKMRLVIRAKALQHEYVRRKLLATGDRELVENSWRDDFWGWGPSRDGKNMLGRLWMGVRTELRASGESL
jgi:N-glycosidase YbiA